MQKFTLVLFLLLAICSFSFGQITIDDNDLMNAGDTFRVSIASNQQYQTSVLAPTGANQTWDFSSLVPISQTIDTFIDVATANLLYLVTYSNFGFNANRANIVQQNTGGINLPLPVTLDNPATFYYKGASNFRSPGTGVELSGLATALPYDTEKDTIYKFPLNFNDTDSGAVAASLSIPGLGSYNTTQKRLWLADGWGTLITPYGTFDVLRVKAKLTGRDSLADTSGFGFAIPRPETMVYRWLGKNQGIPLLEIQTTKNFNVVAISSVRYRDNFTPVLSSMVQNENLFNVGLYPNPCKGDYFTLRFAMHHAADVTVSVYALTGKLVNTKTYNADEFTEQLIVHRFEHKLSTGSYLVKVISESKEQIFTLQVQ
jgi:hypothetical protein